MVINRLRLLIGSLSILLFLVSFTSPTLAQNSCVGGSIGDVDTPCLAPYGYRCNYIDTNNNNHSYCCTNSATCNATKTTMAQQGGSRAGAVFYPTGSCGDGAIDTAIGCLPYKSEGGAFTSALLTFLAGLTSAIALIIMLMATIQIMTGGGNPEQVKKGKELFTGAITGLLFIIFSVTLLRIIAGDIIKLPGF